MKVLCIQLGLWSLGVIKTQIFVAQCEFSGIQQKQVFIQQQARVLIGCRPHTPLASTGTFTRADNEMRQMR